MDIPLFLSFSLYSISHSTTDFLAVFSIPFAQFLVSSLTLLRSHFFSVLRCWIGLVSVVSFSSKSSLFLGWMAYDTTALKKVGKRRTQSAMLLEYYELTHQSFTKIQYVISFGLSDRVVGSVVASVVKLARRLSGTLYPMSPSVSKPIK